MTTSDFSIQTSNTTGPAFRDDIEDSLKALASTNSAAVEPPVTYPGMLQAYAGGSAEELRIRNTDNNDWVTLLPDISKEFGGLDEAISGSSLLALDNIFEGDNDFNGLSDFNGPVQFDGSVTFADNPGFTTPSEVSTAINSAINNIDYIGKTTHTADLDPATRETVETDHNFGAIPRLVTVDVRLQRAVGGYPDNTILSGAGFGVYARRLSSGTVTTLGGGFTVRLTTTEIIVSYGSYLTIVREDNGETLQLDPNDFALVVKAYK